ncbi:MAG: class II aldolase/adducin family protein, partial [Candidatus Cloacimonetes bacterium]|nr:class II aldolase/adducin family protein [Candidatus Cloacimonadota bacterium]
MQIEDLKNNMIETGLKMYRNGYIVASDGNISVRLSPNRFLVTASGVCKGELKAEDIILTDAQGLPLDSDRKPSSEFKLHLEIYHRRNDVLAICHAHSMYCTTLACAGLPLDRPFLAELIINLGYVPLIRYGTPGTSNIFADLTGKIENSKALLLEHHGVVTLGNDLNMAYQRLE